ncbi:putative colanic acid biosynthesis acetyltransferase [Maribacter chungangensis]|uniref:Colanic acid biosynthesis acetyltransferase n=1 Tax=Maribacter chungangensis TaxID=1069117 RepID=A0ABW3B5M8_9FLAO
MNTSRVDYSNYENKLSLKNKMGRLIWNIISLLFFRPFSNPIFRSYRVFVLNLFGAKVHATSLVFSSVRIWAPWNLIMEKHTVLGAYVDCYNPGKVILKSNSIVSQRVFLCSASHNIESSRHNLVVAPIVIESQAWVAAGAYIGMGVTIHEGAVVGATASVFKDVEPWTVVGGNPAKFLKKRVLKD